MQSPSKDRKSGAPGQGASKASVGRGALADLVQKVHRQLDALQPPKGRGLGGSTPASPPLLTILAHIGAEDRGDAGGLPEAPAN